MSSAPLPPHEMVERAIARATGDGCVALVEESTQANLRWASNTLTTNGQTAGRSMTVIALHGTGAGVAAGAVTRTVTSADDVADLVTMAEDVAARSAPEESARPLVPGVGAAGFTEPPAQGGIEVFASLSDSLGDVLDAARASRRLLYGYAEHVLTTTYLGTSAGVRHRHVQPSGHLTMTAKTDDLSTSSWAGRSTRDFLDVDVHTIDAELRRKLDWSSRRVQLDPGRYPTVLPPTAVADLAVYAYWEMAALAAQEGRTVFSDPDRGTRIGQILTDRRVTLRSDPHHPDLACAGVATTPASGPSASVFDNGLDLGPTAWIDQGTLSALVQTRYSAELTGQPVTPAVDNLVLDIAGGSGSVDDLAARLDDGVLVTSLWYIREVDPQALLLTGLTRDGVFVVKGGEVVGEASSFRFNESPVDLLGRVLDAGDTVPTFSREWGEYFPRTAMPALTVDGFHFSTVSDAR